MSMRKVAGTALRFGVPETEGCIAQSGSKTAGGELKVYKDENGNDISLYLNDEHTQATVDGLLTADQAAKSIGDQVTICGVTGYVTAWTIQWQNEEVARVNGSIRTYDIGSAT